MAIATLLVGSPAFAQQRTEKPFDRGWLVEHARGLARQAYADDELPKNSPLGKLDYDRYRAIRFRKGAAIWAREGRNFTLDLLPPGFIFRTPIRVNLVVGGIARSVLFTTQVFEYGLDTAALEQVGAPGYSGLRVSAPIKRAEAFDEVVVFQGASYFRAVGKDNQYGISARGLAIGTASPSGEEFPVFREFWVERPRRDAQRIVIHALLDSPSLTGAYTFSVDPGPSTVIDVEATLFARRKVEAYGLAPLTSMFLFDASNRGRFDDFRPAVCDSDGLSIAMANGERVWRPLANPRTLQVSSFAADMPSGFGLSQRKRAFSDFEDAEARYELRPSLWIEPEGDWGKGRIELVEIPSQQEINDNIVAYWKPARRLRPHQEYSFKYRMYWGDEAPRERQLARVVATRVGRALGSDARLFAIDFDLARIPDDIEVQVSSSAGRILDARGQKLEPSGVYRAFFQFDPEDEEIAELRMVLSSAGKRLGETWLYRFTR